MNTLYDDFLEGANCGDPYLEVTFPNGDTLELGKLEINLLLETYDEEQLDHLVESGIQRFNEALDCLRSDYEVVRGR